VVEAEGNGVGSAIDASNVRPCRAANNEEAYVCIATKECARGAEDVTAYLRQDQRWRTAVGGPYLDWADPLS
jgi:hypothetical protein